VAALAERLGARKVAGGRASLRQSGTLRGLGAKGWVNFTADQWLAAGETAFRWCARVGPLGLVHVEDALVEGEPKSRAKAFGLVPMMRAEPSHELLEGQLQRYLAELAWNPDALLSNPALEWEEKGEGVLSVTQRSGVVAAGVEIHLGADGLPERTFAMRQAAEKGGFVLRPWHGAFSDWRRIEGRLIPHGGRVAWEVDGERFEVWRGRIEAWRPPAA
jgi:hypothetical protein